MRGQPGKRKWTKAQTQILRQYVTNHKVHLRSKFYQNIAAGRIRYRKAKGFFVNMGVKVGKSFEKCKSKFQKMESEIYLELLDIPKQHLELYNYLRTRSKLLSTSVQQVRPRKKCLCVIGNANGSKPQKVMSSRATKIGACPDQIVDKHLYFEKLRIEIILKCKAGKLGDVDLGIAKLGIFAEVKCVMPSNQSGTRNYRQQSMRA